jgi:hypothetical protein
MSPPVAAAKTDPIAEKIDLPAVKTDPIAAKTDLTAVAEKTEDGEQGSEPLSPRYVRGGVSYSPLFVLTTLFPRTYCMG